jgi:hypothetical protein
MLIRDGAWRSGEDNLAEAILECSREDGDPCDLRGICATFFFNFFLKFFEVRGTCDNFGRWT